MTAPSLPEHRPHGHFRTDDPSRSAGSPSPPPRSPPGRTSWPSRRARSGRAGRRASASRSASPAGALLWAFLSAAGTGVLFERYPGALRALGLIGGTYLCWLGFKGLRSAWRGGGGVVAAAESRGAVADVGYGLAVTLSNPKVAFVWASLATFVAPATAGSPTTLALFAHRYRRPRLRDLRRLRLAVLGPGRPRAARPLRAPRRRRRVRHAVHGARRVARRRRRVGFQEAARPRGKPPWRTKDRTSCASRACSATRRGRRCCSR